MENVGTGILVLVLIAVASCAYLLISRTQRNEEATHGGGLDGAPPGVIWLPTYRWLDALPYVLARHSKAFLAAERIQDARGARVMVGSSEPIVDDLEVRDDVPWTGEN